MSEVDRNVEAFADVVQCLNDRSLALVFRDVRNDGRKDLVILREHLSFCGEALYHCSLHRTYKFEEVY